MPCLFADLDIYVFLPVNFLNLFIWWLRAIVLERTGCPCMSVVCGCLGINTIKGTVVGACNCLPACIFMQLCVSFISVWWLFMVALERTELGCLVNVL